MLAVLTLAVFTDFGRTAERVTVEQLVSSYRENELAAERRFGGRLVEVTGSVSAVAHDALGRPYVQIGEIRCTLKKEGRAAAETLRRGEAVTIRGEASRGAIGLTLEECDASRSQ